MPAAFSLRVLDSIIRIELTGTLGEGAEAELAEPWAGLRVEDEGPPDAVIRVVVGDADDAPPPVAGARVVTAATLPTAAQELTTAATIEGIVALHGRALLLHAAGLALDDGLVVGFVGPSGRGKTTASRALAQTYGYVTDETLAVLPDLSVIAYPKPLSVIDGPPPKRSLGPDQLGLQPAPEGGLRLAALALLDRRPDVAAARVEPVGLSEAIGLIVPETSALVTMPRPLGGLVDVIRATGGVRRVVYSDAEQLAALVPHLLTRDADPVEVVEAISADEPAGETAIPDAGYRRGTWQDALSIDDRLVIHDGHGVFVLEGIGPLLWRNADGATLEALCTLAVAEFPAPPEFDACAAVERELDTLVDAGLLMRG